MDFDPKDSIYRIRSAKISGNPDINFCWAVNENGLRYFRLYKDIFVKLFQCENTYCFHVPRTLPDMYAMLSIEETTPDNSNFSSNGNLLWDMAKILVSSALSSIDKKNEEEKIKQRSTYNKYRDCFIDMDTGDIIY
jgi:hypothetical protein